MMRLLEHPAMPIYDFLEHLMGDFDKAGKDPTEFPEAYMQVRLVIYKKLLVVYRSEVDALGWDLVLTGIVLPSLNHASQEVRRLAQQVVVEIYELKGNTVRQILNEHGRILKPVTIKSITAEFDRVDKKQGGSASKKLGQGGGSRKSLGTVKEAPEGRETTPPNAVQRK